VTIGALSIGVGACASTDSAPSTTPEKAPPSAEAGPGSPGPAPDGGSADPRTGDAAPLASRAAALATALRGKPNFLVGMGNDLAANHDLDGAYTLGTTVDLHYAYLVGLKGMGGWPDWNPDGTFVDLLASTADKHGVAPMFTLYSMAAAGESNIGALADPAYMQAYWDGARLLFQRLGTFGKPAAVNLEPDWWGFAMLQSASGTTPARVTQHASECAAQTNDVRGMARCLVVLARTYGPKVSLGFHVSSWSGDAAATIAFFKAIGADTADFITTDMLDRDAGCFEAHVDPVCQRGGTTGWYWDETNTTSPNFHEHLAWVKLITQGIGLPMMWWQVPFGVPSTTPGGTPRHYRDNRVHYLFTHVDEFIAAGGVGALFGVGASNQTDITTDGDSFKTAVGNYFTSPKQLP
jgi:hypothetical protein